MAHLATRLRVALLFAFCCALPLSLHAQDIEVLKNQTNAQNIASVANAAIAAGYDGSNWKTVTDVITSLESGLTVPSGSGQPMTFKVPGLSAEERAAALPYLTLATAPTVSVQYHATPEP